MLGQQTGCHIIKTPTGKYTFAGDVPFNLCNTHEASQNDVMTGRCYKWNGKIMTWRVKSFNSECEARNYAQSVGVELKN